MEEVTQRLDILAEKENPAINHLPDSEQACNFSNPWYG